MNPDPDDLKYVSEAELVSVREQIQEDMLTYLEGYKYFEPMANDLCQIVVDNFKKL